MNAKLATRCKVQYSIGSTIAQMARDQKEDSRGFQ